MGQACNYPRTVVFHLSFGRQKLDGAENWYPFQEHVLRTHWNISSRRSTDSRRPELRQLALQSLPPFFLMAIQTWDWFLISRFLPRNTRITIMRSSSISAKFRLVFCLPWSHDFGFLSFYIWFLYSSGCFHIFSWSFKCNFLFSYNSLVFDSLRYFYLSLILLHFISFWSFFVFFSFLPFLILFLNLCQRRNT